MRAIGSARSIRGLGFRLAAEELAHPRIVARVAQDPGVALGNDALLAFVEHDHAVGNRIDAGELVGHDHEGDVQALGQPQDELVEFGGGDRIQPRRRLVQEQDHRIERHRACDGRALLHAAADFGWHMAGKCVEADQFQLHSREQVHGAGIELRVFLQLQAHVFQKRHRPEQRTALVHDADLPQDRVAPVAFGGDDIVAIDQHLPRHRLVKADHVLEQRALATTGAAENDEHLAAADREIDVLHQDVFVVARREVFDADDRIGGHARAFSDIHEIVDERE